MCTLAALGSSRASFKLKRCSVSQVSDIISHKSCKVIQDVGLVHPFGATLYGDEIVWTDWGRRSVEAASKIGNFICYILFNLKSLPSFL